MRGGSARGDGADDAELPPRQHESDRLTVQRRAGTRAHGADVRIRSKTVQIVSFGGMRADAEDSYEDLGIQAAATLVVTEGELLHAG